MNQPQVLLLDLEGTVHTREGMIEGVPQALEELRSQGHVLRFLTNTDSASSDGLLAKVRGLGLRIEDEELFTPVTAARAMLSAAPGARALMLTTAAVRDEVAAGVEVCADGQRPTHVVVGDVRDTLDYVLLNSAFAALHEGAELVALQRGRFFLSGGRAHLDTGAVVAALEYAAGTQATVVGKPSRTFLDLATADLEPAGPRSVWVVGDDRTTDIPMGHAAGMRTVQVRTGKFALQQDEPDAHPEHVLDSLAQLPDLLRRSDG